MAPTRIAETPPLLAAQHDAGGDGNLFVLGIFLPAWGLESNAELGNDELGADGGEWDILQKEALGRV